MDVVSQLGELALGSRLRRLSDYIMKNGREIYKAYNIDFDPRCFPVYYYLSEEGEKSIMEIAEATNMVHPTVIKLARQLEKDGYVLSRKDEKDGRRRLLSLSKKGYDLLPEMKVAWLDLSNSIREMLQDNRINILDAISEMERGFEEKGFLERVKSIRQKRLFESVEIVDYQAEYGPEFKEINYDWIRKYFVVEQADIDALENHKAKILDTGGAILFAKVGDEIAGTCALINFGEGVYELAKMGVKENFRGRQIGKKLGQAIIDLAEKNGAKTLFLESNKSLAPAINLYRRLGFIEVSGNGHISDYARSNIKMEIHFG